LSSPGHSEFEPIASTPAAEDLGAPEAPQQNPAEPNTMLPTFVPAPPPIEDPVFSGWDVLLLTLLTVATIFVLNVSLVLFLQAFRWPRLGFAEVALRVTQTPILIILSQLLVYIPVVVTMIVLVEGKYHVRFWEAVRWSWPRSPWTYLGLGVLLFFALLLLESLLPMPQDTPFSHLFDRPRDAYLLMILAVAIAPLMEELFFRGFLYPVLARRLGAAWGIVLTALPFGLLHLQQYGWAWSAAFIIFLVGVVCGMVRASTRSVGASFLVHAAYNGTQMLIAVVATHGFRHM